MQFSMYSPGTALWDQEASKRDSRYNKAIDDQSAQLTEAGKQALARHLQEQQLAQQIQLQAMQGANHLDLANLNNSSHERQQDIQGQYGQAIEAMRHASQMDQLSAQSKRMMQMANLQHANSMDTNAQGHAQRLDTMGAAHGYQVENSALNNATVQDQMFQQALGQLHQASPRFTDEAKKQHSSIMGDLSAIDKQYNGGKGNLSYPQYLQARQQVAQKLQQQQFPTHPIGALPGDVFKVNGFQYHKGQDGKLMPLGPDYKDKDALDALDAREKVIRDAAGNPVMMILRDAQGNAKPVPFPAPKAGASSVDKNSLAHPDAYIKAANFLRGQDKTTTPKHSDVLKFMANQQEAIDQAKNEGLPTEENQNVQAAQERQDKIDRYKKIVESMPDDGGRGAKTALQAFDLEKIPDHILDNVVSGKWPVAPTVDPNMGTPVQPQRSWLENAVSGNSQAWGALGADESNSIPTQQTPQRLGPIDQQPQQATPNPLPRSAAPAANILNLGVGDDSLEPWMQSLKQGGYNQVQYKAVKHPTEGVVPAPVLSSDDEDKQYNLLPSGTMYIDARGVQRIKK